MPADLAFKARKLGTLRDSRTLQSGRCHVIPHCEEDVSANLRCIRGLSILSFLFGPLPTLYPIDAEEQPIWEMPEPGLGFCVCLLGFLEFRAKVLLPHFTLPT